MAFVDFSTNNFQLTAYGNTAISTVEKKYGNGSGYFDGDGDCISLNGDSAFAFGTGDFTVEFWAYVSDWGSRNIYESRGLGEESNRITIYTNNNTFIFYNAGNQITSNSKNSNQWYHVAVCRASGTTRMFIDGVQEGGDYTDSTNYGIGINRPLIGAYEEVRGDGYYQGYIDELRVTKGVARYTANFVPQTAPFANPVPPSIPSGYLAFWKLDNTNDSSVNGNNLTNNGSVQFVTGKIGNCAEFNGSNYLSNNNVSVAGGSFTVSQWIYVDSSQTGVFSETVSRWYQGSSGSFVTGLNEPGQTSDMFFGYCNTTNGTVRVEAPITYDQWTQYIIRVIDGVSVEAFKNGQFVSNNSMTGNVIASEGDTEFQIGAGESSGQFPITGKIDAVGIWTRALTNQEILDLYNSGNGLEP